MTASPVIIGSEHVPVSASIGIAVGTIGETTTGELLRHSDAAMYTAKAQANRSAEIFESEADFDQRTLGRLEMELDLRHGLERDQLVLHY
jgi:predicted signal transduction protein with EAL and GGDEF domain